MAELLPNMPAMNLKVSSAALPALPTNVTLYISFCLLIFFVASTYFQLCANADAKVLLFLNNQSF
jgi:hypothetical protein